VPGEHDRKDPRFGTQFGLTPSEMRTVARRLAAAGAAVEGVHFHLGQGQHRPADYAGSIHYVVDACRDAGLSPRYIDCGGGFDEDIDLDATLSAVNAAMESARQALPTVREVWLENGRYVTQASAALVVRVLDVKERPECRYLICDGGRTNQALDADNGVHPLLIVPNRSGNGTLTTIAGPTCMTDDRLGRVMLPANVRRSDLIVWLEAGAYHLPWETRFSRGLCAVVWADETDALSLVRAAETPDTWRRSWQA
jgi:diaminopimelate decarboxylase